MLATSTRRRPREDDDTQGPPCTQCRTRKVKCDRQQPDCSNCRRGGVACEYSNSSSKVYQVKELLDAFTSVTSRLDRLESTLALLVDQMKKPAATGLESPSTSNTITENRETSQRPAVDEPVAAQQQITHPTPEDNELTEPYPAVLSLFRSLHRRLERAVTNTSGGERRDIWALAAQQLGPRQILREQVDKFPFGGGCLDYPITGDGQPIQAPPRWAVEDCVDMYLIYVNSHTPIFAKTELQDGIAFYYDSPPCQQVDVQALTYSNVLLLAKTLDFTAGRQGEREPEEEAAELELIRVLLRNCDRVMENLGEFLKPTMEYLRGLLTLALVCQHYYSAPAFTRVLLSVTSLVRTMGLHQTTLHLSSSWGDLSESERFFWIAYSLDKQNVFVSGLSGELYLFDCRFPLHPCDGENPTPRQIFGALTHLMAIWEDIYTKLYSPRSTMYGTEGRETQAHALRLQLNTWEESHRHLLGAELPTLCAALSTSQSELIYAQHVTRSLIDRCDPSLPPSFRYLTPSRLALETITTPLDTGTPRTRHEIAILSRMFRNYPIVPFHDLFISLLTGPKSLFTPSAELLHATRRALESLTNPFPDSFFNKLHAGFAWCTAQLDILYNMLAYFNSPQGCPDFDYVVGGVGVGVGLGGLGQQFEAGGARRVVGLSDAFFDVASGGF
ncbi:hypothetical protein BJX64DRAFT_291170 [Aspergillus heterothallicus]